MSTDEDRLDAQTIGMLVNQGEPLRTPTKEERIEIGREGLQPILAKAELLQQLDELGYHSSGRKKRSDVGKPRVITKTRSDKGTKRTNYSKNTSGYARRQFKAFIRTHTLKDGTGDDLTRDDNMLFAPRTTHFFREITVSRREHLNKKTGVMQVRSPKKYLTKTRRPNHPEKLRWNWYMKEYQEATGHEKDEWLHKICSWYFIKSRDILDWTYSEWAWSYVHAIGGHFNRMSEGQIILDYDRYLGAGYGIANFDLDGNIKWDQ